MGFEPLVAPLLALRFISGGEIDLTGMAALAFTSANGVAAFAARSRERGLPVFAVGGATAAAARDHGFAGVVSAGGDVAALAAVIAAHGGLTGEVLHPGPAEPAGDLVGDLAARGVRARAMAVYETAPCPPPPDAAALIAGAVAALVHSPKAAHALATHLAACPAPGLWAICLSPAVAAPLAGADLAAVRVAAEPAERALLDALRNLAGA
jgi:uroporphyrinogen-III synthase